MKLINSLPNDNMKKIILLLMLIFNTSIFAEMNIIDSELSNIVTKAKSLDQAKKYSAAADAYLEALNLRTTASKKELDRKKDGYPISAYLRARRIICLGSISKFTKDFENECHQALKKYKKKPGENVLTPYIQINQNLLNYYFYLNDIEKIENTVFEVTDYDPRAFTYVYHFLWKTLEKPIDYANEQLAHPHYKETLLKIKQSTKNYEKTNPPVNPQIQLFKLKLLEANDEDVFTAAANLLKNNPQSENLLAVLGIMRDAINPDKPEQIKQYYKMLITLAIKQPSDQKHIKIVGALLSEKKKLETIMPEIKTSK